MNDTAKQQLAWASMPIDEDSAYTQQRAYAGDVIYTEAMACTHMYVIKEGEVDIYMIREEKRVVVKSLGRGQCFGMTPRLLNCKRTSNAAARTYCELYLIENEKIDAELKATPKLMLGILRTLAEQSNLAGEVIATR
ncbi:cyclic nucleotide-binding domain-containing protein, partial [Roseateles sp. GG27B]